MRKYLKFLSPVMFLLSACQTNFTNRTVASGENESVETQFYETKLQQSFLEDQEKYQNKISDLYKKDSVMERNIIYDVDPKLKGKIEALEQRSNYYKNNLLKSAQNHNVLNVPIAKTFSFDLPWRQHHDQFILQNLEAYNLENGKVQKQLVLSTDTTRRLILRLVNKSYNWNGKAKSPSLQIGQPKPQDPHLKASMTCDHDMNHLKSSDSIRIPKGINYEFDWYDESKNIPRTLFEISHPNTHCEFKFREPDQSREYGIHFIPEAQQMKKISSPNLNYELCYMPKNSNLKGMDHFFTDSNTDHMTCPQKAEHFKTLEDPYEGIRAKIKLLTGKDISNEYIKAGDPFKPLDFSQAPKLDAVLISYLVFRSDFSGNVILEALKYHAKRGTIIRIAISDVITLRKDRQMLLAFQAQYPNVKLLFYKYKPQNLGFRDMVGGLHRTNHIKVFLTYSETNPENNNVIFGGRNIHDGFLFDQPSANYIYPTLIDYREGGDENWARWEDFETLFQSTQLVKTIMGQFFSVTNADFATVFTRDYTQNIQTPTLIDPQYLNLKDNEVLIRSFVSIPFKDDMLLETTFVKMIDSAQREINISTPYFHLTEKLLQALSRASDRGVKIQLITRLDLDGDTADIVLAEVNKASINKLYKKIKIYEYTTVGKILHTKFFLIDGKFVMMGSVNLNKRSFYHDIENATLVYGAAFTRKLNALYEVYKKESKLLTEKQKTVFWKKIIIKIAETEL